MTDAPLQTVDNVSKGLKLRVDHSVEVSHLNFPKNDSRTSDLGPPEISWTSDVYLVFITGELFKLVYLRSSLRSNVWWWQLKHIQLAQVSYFNAFLL